MADRMIFFHDRRRINWRVVAVCAVFLTLTATSFAAGVKVGVAYATPLSNLPFLQVQTASADL